MKESSRMKPPLAAALACLLVLGAYAACAHLGTAVFGNDDPNEAVYNRLIDGFAQGHLYLRRDVPAAFAALADPYDPAQNAPYRVPPYYLYDLSYYHGRLYAYFGPLPALLVFWPYHLVTGDYLSYKAAAAACSCLGFLAVAWLFLDAQRRYAPAMPAWLLAALLLAIGLTTALPLLLVRVDVWEIPIAASSALTLAFLAALWQAWHHPAQQRRWLAAASVALGFAVASRPTTLLLAPLLAWPWLRQRAGSRPPLRPGLLAAAALPLGGCLAALLLYNYARFGQPLEFGQRYQLPFGEYEGHIRHFSPAYLWDNLRVYFLHPAPWTAAYPFVGEPSQLAFRSGHSGTEFNFGVLANVPLVWFALLALPAVRRPDGIGFLAGALVAVGGAQIGLLLLFFGTVSRYEVEILVPLILLAAAALLAGEAGRSQLLPRRILWLALAACSIAFNLAYAADHAIKTRIGGLSYAVSHGQLPAALDHADALVLLQPGSAGFHNERGIVLGLTGRLAESVTEFRTAIRLDPHALYARHNLGRALLQTGDRAGAIGEMEADLRLAPGDAAARSLLEMIRRNDPSLAPAGG